MPEVSAADLAKLRSGPQASNLYLVVQQPEYRDGNAWAGYLWCAQINGVPLGDPVASLTVDNSSGNATLLDGMTVFIGSEPGAWDKAIVRLRGDQNVTGATVTLNIAASSNLVGNVEDNDWVTVLDEFRLWQRYQRIVESGGALTWYKDWDILWTDTGANDATRRLATLPPVPIMGPHVVRFIEVGGSTDIDFDWSDSYAVAAGAAVSSWASSGEDGGAGWTDNVQNPAPKTYSNVSGLAGFRTVLEVDDGNGNAVTLPFRRGVRYVFTLRRPGQTQAGDPPNAEPIVDFAFEGSHGSFAQGFHRCNIRIFGSVASEYTILPGALVIVFAEDWFENSRTSIGPIAGRENIIVIGRVLEGTVRQNSETGDVTFSIVSDGGLAQQMENYPIACEYDNAADEWYKVPNLTVDRAIRHYVAWHTTMSLIADFYPTGDTELISAQDFHTATIYSAIDGMLRKRLVARLLCDRYDRFKCAKDVQIGAPGAATTLFGLTDGDWIGNIQYREVMESPCNVVDAGGVHFDGADATPFLSHAPGDASLYRGSAQQSMFLTVADQSALNTLSGRLLAYKNNQYPRMDINFAGNWRVFDIWPQEYVIVSTDTVRHDFLTDRFIPREISIKYDAAAGAIFVSCALEAETDGPPGTTVDIPEDPPSGPGSDASPPPAPPGYGGAGSGDTVYVLTSDGFFRVTGVIAGPAVWEDIGPTLSNGENFEDFILDPFDPKNTAYLVLDANNNSGIACCKTTNLTASNPVWTTLLTGQDLTNAGVSSVELRAIHGALTNQDFIVVTGGAVGSLYCGHTHDGGATWTWVSVGVGQTYSGNAGLEVSDHDSDYIWVGITDGSGQTGIYRSTDGGHTFSSLYTWGANYTSWAPFCISVPYSNNATDQIMLASVYKTSSAEYEVWKSTNGGAAWTLLNGNPGLPVNRGAWLNSFECSPYNSNAYHFFDGNNYYLYVSEDAGATWVEHPATGAFAHQWANYRDGGRWLFDTNRFYVIRAAAATSPAEVFWITTNNFDDAADRTGNYWSIRSSWAVAPKRLIALWVD